MKSFKDELKFGTQEEDNLFTRLEKFFGDNITQVDKEKNPFCKWDYEGNKCIYEIKSRHNKMWTFPDTIIAVDKVIEGKEQYFIFNFQDKLTYIKYDEKVFKSFKCDYFKRKQRIDFNDKRKKYFFIPIIALNEILV